MLNSKLLVITAFLILISCTNKTSNLNESKPLTERLNQYPELRKALLHYRAPADSLKRKALFFLINNLENKTGLNAESDRQITVICKKMYLASLSDTFDLKKTYYNPNSIDFKHSLDVDVIKSDDLIENIDYAFEAYRFPWAKKVPFKDFCEFVLPHRILHESLSNWRKYFFQKNKKLVQYLLKNKIEDEEVICKILNDTILKRYKFYSNLQVQSPNLVNLDKYPIGECIPRYILYMALARSIGLPVALDYTPQFSNFGGIHNWVTLIRRNILPFNAGDQWQVSPFYGVKYFRRMYSNSLTDKSLKSPLSNPNLMDVTSQYNLKNSNLIMGYHGERQTEIYLFTFGIGKDLICLQKGDINNGNLIFKNISHFIDSLLFIGYYEGDTIVPVDNPFFIRNWTQNLSYISPTKSITKSIRLFSKFPEVWEEHDFYNEVQGAKIQGSNFKDFRTKTDIFIFEKYPKNVDKVVLKNNFDFNYYRYLPNSTGNINLAELQFFFNKEQKKGSQKEYYLADNKLKKINLLCDNNTRTNFLSSDGNWIGIDRSNSIFRKLKAVKIIPRNAYNLVEKDNDYELFYFDYGWKSVGTKTAKDSFIDFENVPCNAVLLLKNLTQGHKERIFVYEYENQSFAEQVFH